jgi:UDP-glucose 4-epimerase
VIRFFSLYGPGLRKQLLWDVAGKLSREVDEITLFGTGNEMRDMLYVSDAAELCFLAAQLATSQCLIVNGGTGVASSVQTIASELARALGSRCRVRFNGDLRVGDPSHLQASTKRAAGFGFTPRWSLRDGIEAYAAWWQNCAKADVGTCGKAARSAGFVGPASLGLPPERFCFSDSDLQCKPIQYLNRTGRPERL